MRSRTNTPTLLFTMLATFLLSTACAQAGARTAAEPTTEALPTASTSSTASTPVPPCDPGGGLPTARDGCPDPAPETAWLSTEPDGRVLLEPFRTLGDDAEGRAYARERGLEFPFPNDYVDAPDGPSYELDLARETVCTGIMLVGYREPLEDHAVDCAELVDAAAGRRVPVAVWRADDQPVQVSELYRP